MDNLDYVWDRFFKERTQSLWTRFPGFYRAQVVETNDPLQFYRVRFKCPELHDSTLRPEQCPWAIPAPWIGGSNAGSWSTPVIGDIVWVTWEKGHPYGPIWVGFADASRRKLYPLQSMFTESPLSVTLDGKADAMPNEFLDEYLPKDFRPMAFGMQDLYGSAEVSSSIGFFPTQHSIKPAPLGQDPIANRDLDIGNKPEVNAPDKKYMIKISKYGILSIHSDVGYFWQKPEKDDSSQEFGEFRGEFEEDREFEIRRYKYLTRLLNEDEPNSENKDQRRWEVRTRAGHLIEARDVGWANESGGRVGCDDAGPTKSRDGEYGEPRILAKSTDTDERWFKMRTKGGHLLQAMDMGFHPEEDNFYKRKLLEEHAPKTDKEEDHDWTQRDARMWRMITRHGFKLVLDDRGSDTSKAEEKLTPRGNGWMLRSRRPWESSESADARGFTIEANDKDELNTTRWYTPKSKIIELNDKKDYMMMCTDTKGDICREWKGLEENEFALRVAMTEDPESDTYHLKLDKFNGYLRLKTAAGGDNNRRPEPEVFSSAESGLNQGLEARDGRFGSDGAWTEVVDLEHRGMWWSKDERMGIWRSKENKDQFIMISDGKDSIIIRNNEDGPLQIFAKRDVQIIADQNISLKAAQRITMRAGQEIAFEVGGGHAKLLSNGWFQDVPDNAPEHTGRLPGAAPGPGAQSNTGQTTTALNPQIINQDKREPSDRGGVLNTPFDEVDEKVVRMCDK